jgi:hypothetical protein
MKFDLSKYIISAPGLEDDNAPPVQEEKKNPSDENNEPNQNSTMEDPSNQNNEQDKNYDKKTEEQPEQEHFKNILNPQSIGLIDGWAQTYNKIHDEYLPGIENLIKLEDDYNTPSSPMMPNQPNPQMMLQNYLRKLFFIRTNAKENDFTVYFQLSHDKIRDMFCHFFDTRLKSHNVSLIFGTAMSLKDQTPQQVWRLNSLISSIQLSQAGSIVGYALGWLDATETLLWTFCPERYIAEDSYAALTFDWNGFDYIASKKNIHRVDQQRYVDRFKSLGLLTSEECTKYMRGTIITLTADEVADRLRQTNNTEKA